METNTQELKNFEFGNATDVGCRRENNEDYLGYFETPNGYLFVVCDGMGGHQAGEKASQLAVEVFKRFFTETVHNDLKEALWKATVEANRVIYETAQKYKEYAGMGTTLVAAIVKDNQVFYVHVGDSRLYFYEKNTKKLHRITKDHSFVQQLVDNGIITEAEAEAHPRKNEILRALGIDKTVTPEVGVAPILPADNDLMLLCSDGLNSMIADTQIQDIITEDTQSILQRTLKLVESAKNAGGHDNITAQLVRFYAQGRKDAKLPPGVTTNPHTPPASNSSKKQFVVPKKVFWGVSVIALLLVVFAFYIWDTNKNDKKQEKTPKKDTLQAINEDTLSKKQPKKTIPEDSVSKKEEKKTTRNSIGEIKKRKTENKTK
jgi:serine/threonine protein phosphatase PrpC